ncbi:unnamed protein product [Triticum turgidum subsp. durum]|uniref:non-specific serine/threonine protein kinase n=1 Tax=Triticum turgidum subsp. durum TaxID=4567 RepID=A0A9R0RE79_TRITD|nr:unnamed protein product [Triticum turgidum subsp. durum]
MERKSTILMNRYELGRMLGQGTFAKVYHARSLATNQSVAIKVIDKDKVLRVGMIDQIKREISIMRLVRHPYIVQLHEVMASKSKIYFAMEYVRGGELFARVAKGRLKEDAARKYFQQLIGAVDFCHSRDVYHRDLKPENLLVDEHGNLKVSDFGLSALKECQKQDGLLHTTCGTLFVLLAGYLPFQDSNLMEMYRKISKGDVRHPQWFSSDARKILSRLLDPNPNTRITMDKLIEHPWFKKGYKPAVMLGTPTPRASKDLNDVQAAFSTDHKDGEGKRAEQPNGALKPASLNAFDIISLSKGFDLSGLFEKDQEQKSNSRFMTQKPASAIVSKLEQIAETESFKVKKQDGLVTLQGSKEGRKGQLAIDAEIFEVTPSFYVVEVKKSAGDTLEYERFCKMGLRPSLKDICWNGPSEEKLPSVSESVPPTPSSKSTKRNVI